MFFLLKQAFKSLKHSILELIGLIFIFFIVVFTVFSTMFMFFNIDFSLTDLRTQSNASNIVVEKKYNKSSPIYNYEANLNTPVIKSVYVSKYKYDASLPLNDINGFANNVIFPYTTSDFNNVDPSFGVNSIDPVGVSPYDDKNLSRYTNRKKGILKANSNNLGLIQNINVNNSNTWRGIGWQMVSSDTGKLVFDPINLVYDANSTQPKIEGYFNNGVINSTSILNYGLYQPKSAQVDPSITNGVVKQPAINLIVSQPINIDWNIDDNVLNNLAFYNDLFTSLKSPSNTIKQNVPYYKIYLDTTSLFGIDKYIYEKITNIVNSPEIDNPDNPNHFYKDFLLSLISLDMPIRDEWITQFIAESHPPATKEEALKTLLKNKAQDLSRTFTKFILNYRDEFIFDYINTKYNADHMKGQTIGENKSFSFFDREANKNYLVTSKDSATIDKLVMSSGVAPKSANKFHYYIDSINRMSLIDNIYYKQDFNKLIYAFSQLLTKLERTNINQNPSNFDLYDAMFDQSNIDFSYLELAYDNNKPSAKIDIIISIAKELVIQYESKDFSKKGFDNRLVSKLFSYLSSPKITIDEFRKLSIDFDYLEGIYAGSSINSLRVSGLFHQNYQAVVTNKFIENSDKKILPLTNALDPILSWNYALSLTSPKEFDSWLLSLPSEYKLEINSLPFVITGTGISSDMAYPVTSLENPIINATNDILIYVNDAGYNAISKKLPFTSENKYFSFVINNPKNINAFTSELNNNLSPIMNGSTSNVAFTTKSNFLMNPLVSLRYSFPSLIQFYIQIFSIIISILLSIVGIYLCFTIIKLWINKMKTQLAIIKANGFSTLKITMCMSFLPLIISVIGGGLGYILAILFQHSIFSIVSSYLFLSTNFFTFNLLIFAGIIIGIFLVSLLFIFINLKILFRKPISGIINQTIEIKNNLFIRFLNKVQFGFNANMKLKNQLLFLNVPRAFFYLTSSTMCVFFISAFSSFSEKLNLAQDLTVSNKQYNYSIDLLTPTESGGLYKSQKYSELGFADEKRGIYDMYQYLSGYNWRYPYTPTDLKVLEKIQNPNGVSTWEHKKGEDGRLLYFSNLLLPSETFMNNIDVWIDVFRNVVFSKWLIDIEIQNGFNIWEFIKGNLNPEIIAKVETQDKIFVDLIANDPDLGTEFKNYTIRNQITGQLKLDARKVLEFRPVLKFNNQFLSFIGKVYGKEHISNADIKISYGTIPYFNSQTEYYTYVDANITNKNINKNYKIYGIQPNSKFMILKDNDGKYIGHLLDDTSKNSIIINNGAAYKYGLKVGDKLTLDVLNSYFRYSEKMFEVDLPDSYEFEIVGINSTSFGEEFFINQNKANQITRLKDGVLRLTAGNSGTLLPSILPEKTPIYNGIFSTEIEPLLLTKTLSFYSLFGSYGNFAQFNLNNRATATVLKWSSTGELFHQIFRNGAQHEFMVEAYNKKYNKNFNIDQIRDEIRLKKFGNNMTQFVKVVTEEWFQENIIPITLNSLENYSLEKELNSSIFMTLETLQILLMSILLPIIIFVILILTSQMMQEIRRIILIMKLLGYSNKHNLFNILFVFFPIFIFSLLLGSLFVWITMLGFQAFMYSTAAIFVNGFINVPNLMYSFLVLLIIMFINFIFTLCIYRKTNLNLILN